MAVFNKTVVLACNYAYVYITEYTVFNGLTVVESCVDVEVLDSTVVYAEQTYI